MAIINSNGSLKGTVSEPLELIPEKSFIELSNILRKDTLTSFSALGMVQNVIRWRSNANIPADQKLYAPSGNHKDGTCIGIYDTDAFQFFTFNTRDPEDHKLRNALLTTNLISWGRDGKKICKLLEVPENLVPIVKEVATKKKLDMFCDVTLHCYLEIEEAIKLELRCPPGVKLGRLTVDHAPYLDQHWPHRFNGSQDDLRLLLERNFGVGAFVEGTGMPVAWVVLNQNSCMVMLNTLEAHRRKGYAELVCNAMAKRLAEMEVYPRATVIENNQSAMKLFTKMGYKFTHVLHFIRFKPEENR